MSSQERFEDKFGVIEANPIAWEAWKTAERQALERAAQICEQLWTRAGDADQCADAIRALMQNASSEKEQNNG